MKANQTKSKKKLTEKEVSNVKLKYHIKELLYSMPYEESVNARKMLPKWLNITRQTFAKWCNIKDDEKVSIPSDEFLALAVFFNVDPFELLTGAPLEINPNISDSPQLKNVAKKYELVK